ncbi:phosphotransferase [Nonomuraea sp. SBT364]|uniref:phosphotransferase n=1 Tax=Nonomuraea sp. SBT364 TaxID=1580530 RepID=UPI00066AB760|nr:phosphotransferase [Nonomuraea sp. SBT364]
MADLQGTHAVEVRGDVVSKRYKEEKPGAAEREWRALTLLARYAPGLAPRPISNEGGVIMSRIDGVPLRGLADAPALAAALARAVAELHAAVPPQVLAEVPVRNWGPAALAEQVSQWCARWPGRDPLADRAVREGGRWLERWRPREGDLPPVLGAGDGNLANFLWDGERVRIVDFEDSGRSDRAYELSELSQHVSMWVDGEIDVLSHVELTAAERARLRECTRLHALTWLFLLSGEGPRNPPGTFGRQVERVLAVLEAPA